MNNRAMKHKTGMLPVLKHHMAGFMLLSCLVLTWASPAQAVSLKQMMTDFGVQQPRVVKPAPDFSLPNLTGAKVSLSDYRGTLVLLHFWATWCVPCRHEMPLLHSLEGNIGRDFQIICVNVDRGDKDKVKAFIDEITPHFHSLLDPDGSVRSRYAIRGLPTSYLIGRDGNIIGRIIGERDWSSPAMVDFIQRLAHKKLSSQKD